jgi:hypothetical protein
VSYSICAAYFLLWPTTAHSSYANDHIDVITLNISSDENPDIFSIHTGLSNFVVYMFVLKTDSMDCISISYTFFLSIYAETL